MVAPVSGRMMHIVPCHWADRAVWSVAMNGGLSYAFHFFSEWLCGTFGMCKLTMYLVVKLCVHYSNRFACARWQSGKRRFEFIIDGFLLKEVDTWHTRGRLFRFSKPPGCRLSH